MIVNLETSSDKKKTLGNKSNVIKEIVEKSDPFLQCRAGPDSDQVKSFVSLSNCVSIDIPSVSRYDLD